MAVGLGVEFVYVALTRGGRRAAAQLASVGALVLATVVALLALPALANRAWHAAPPGQSGLGAGPPAMIGGTWWSIARLLLSVAGAVGPSPSRCWAMPPWPRTSAQRDLQHMRC